MLRGVAIIMSPLERHPWSAYNLQVSPQLRCVYTNLRRLTLQTQPMHVMEVHLCALVPSYGTPHDCSDFMGSEIVQVCLKNVIS